MANGFTPEQFREILENLNDESGEKAKKRLSALEEQLQKMQDLQRIEEEHLVRLVRGREIIEVQNDLLERQIRLNKHKIRQGEILGNIEVITDKLLENINKTAESIPSLAETLMGGDKGGEKLISQLGQIESKITGMFKKDTTMLIKNMGVEINKLGDIFSQAEDVYAGARAFGADFKTAATAAGGVITQNIDAIAAAMKSLVITGATAVGMFAGLAGALFIFQTIRLASRLENQAAAFMKATGASRDYASGITISYEETREFGASIEEVGQAFQSLFKNYTDFTFLNEQVQVQIRNTTTLLSKLGVSSDDTAKSMMALTRNMGMGPEGAAQSMLNLTKFAQELQVPISQVTADFAAQSGALAKLGDEGFRSFMRLEIAAKASGLRVERLMAIISKFDTFEGAAESAGKLNAALGGNFVNAMDLMMATDPVDRFNQIKDALDNAGLSFDTMGYYQREFIAKSAGLSDASELALVMKGRYDLLSDSLTMTTADYEEQAKAAKDMMNFQEKLNALFAQLIPIIEPLVDLMSDLASVLLENADTLKTITGVLLGAGGAVGIVGAFATLMGVGGPVGAAIGAIIGGLVAISAAFLMLLGHLKIGNETVAGMLIEGFVFPFKLIYYGLKEIYGYFSSFFSFISSSTPPWIKNLAVTWLPRLIKMFAAATATMMIMLNPLTMIAGTVLMVVGAFTKLGKLLFRTTFASNFLEGLIKIGNAFQWIVENIANLLLKFNPLLKGFQMLGNSFKGILSFVAAPFATGTGSMAGASATAATNAVRANAATAQQAQNAANNGGEMTISQPVEVKINGDVLEKFIIKVVGENVRSIRVTQS